ncbi:phage tail tip fiber protein [Plesiomonas shigelloides]|uniref:phage tail tip fiber protein n=1 Tax=Plesiomonas shigelloides TaxID=703 RepID=UPI00387F1C90
MSKATFRASADSKAVAENMQILTGQKGDKLDKALTYREAAAIGILKLRRSGSGAIIPENPTPPERDPVWQGVEKPHAPVNVTADGAFHTVTLTWDIPTYKGHAFAEVWRAEFDDAVADKGNNIAKAVRVGTTLANVYADAVGKGFKAFYWVRFVNKNGYNGPYQSALGLLAETSADVDEIIASATNFAIYNPAKPTEKEIIFGVTDDGKVGIREAVIKKATIQIIHSEKITADYIKAGVSISAPLISGGSFDMGNAYMSGGAAGFGLGGPYSGWGKGWNSIIYSDGSIYTNRLNAEGGNIRDMRMERCVIAESCDVRGTLYAEKIVGDIVRTYAMGIGSVVTVEAVPFARLVQWQVIVSSGRESTTATATLNGGGVGSLSATRIMYDVVGAPGFVNSIPVPVPKSAVFTASIPAHQPATLGLTGSIGRDGAASAVAIISKI